MNVLSVSGSPHVQGDQNVKKIMYGVVIAMIPALAVSLYMFGLGALRVTLVSVIACLVVEYLIQRFIIKGPVTITDGSGLITGLLLAFNMPSSLPSWMIIIGAVVAIGVAKMSFGGLGKNPFNPALVGRVFLLISFPVDMTTWPKPIVSREFFSFNGLDDKVMDSVTGPTPLGIVKEGGDAVLPGYADLLLGQMSGSLGEISAAAIILGGIYMLIRKIITWHIPLTYLLSSYIFAGILWLINPEMYVDPNFHMLTGGMMLGAIFMATDMVSSPISKKGMIVFGIGCGILTIIIRIWGAYPEGVSFAILIMNAFTPLINRAFKPKRFGEVVKDGK